MTHSDLAHPDGEHHVDELTSFQRVSRALNPFLWLRQHHFGVTLFFLIFSFIAVLMWNSIFVSKQAGEQGVYWSRFFGGTSDLVLGEGTHVKFPWDDIIIYNTRVSVTHLKTLLLTKDGMEIDVEWSVRHRVNPQKLPFLHRTIGPLFEEKIIVPEVISSLRQVLGNYTADEIYARDEVALIAELEKRVKDSVEEHPIFIESVMLLRLDLPRDMAKGIVDKLLFEQTLLAYKFRLQAEEQERQRKTIEATGIKAFEDISKVSILKWRGIDATNELAKSPNAKIIVMGTGPNGLPLLLNADK